MTTGKSSQRGTQIDPETADPDGADCDRAEPAPVARLSVDIKAQIGRQLRQMYDEIADEGVPERFIAILRGLDDPEGSKNGSA